MLLLLLLQVSGSMVFKGKRGDFLSNKENKHRFITLLQDHLERQDYHTEQATADADLLIVQTAIAASENASKHTALVGEDTYLLVLLCFHTKSTSRNIYFRPEAKHGAKHPSAGTLLCSKQRFVRKCATVCCLCMLSSGVIPRLVFTGLERKQHSNLHIPVCHSEDMFRSSMILNLQRLT